MNLDEKYLYSVHPRKIIRDLPGILIKHPRSLYLTKEQVKICLKSASIYRRFANENRLERVTVSNVDRMHNAKFMTEEQYKIYLNDKEYCQRGKSIVDNATTKQEKKEDAQVDQTQSNFSRKTEPQNNDNEEKIKESKTTENLTKDSAQRNYSRGNKK